MVVKDLSRRKKRKGFYNFIFPANILVIGNYYLLQAFVGISFDQID